MGRALRDAEGLFHLLPVTHEAAGVLGERYLAGVKLDARSWVGWEPVEGAGGEASPAEWEGPREVVGHPGHDGGLGDAPHPVTEVDDEEDRSEPTA